MISFPGEKVVIEANGAGGGGDIVTDQTATFPMVWFAFPSKWPLTSKKI